MTQTLDIDETPLTLLLEPVRFQNNRHRNKLPDDYVYWVLIARTDLFGKPDNELLHLDDADSAALFLKLTEEWDPSVRSFFELQNIALSSTLRVSSSKPDIPFWSPNERIILLGDAVHAISPCGGVGAVTALRDAAVLAGMANKWSGRQSDPHTHIAQRSQDWDISPILAGGNEPWSDTRQSRRNNSWRSNGSHQLKSSAESISSFESGG
jgi:hypothetical protein